MSVEEKVLKQGDTLNLAAGTKFGVNESVTFSSSNTSLVTVTNAGLATVVGNPTKKEKVVISSKTTAGVPLGNYIIFVIPSTQAKSDAFKEAASNSVNRITKQGDSRNIVVDKGQGPHVGITYRSSDPSTVSVSATGEVTILKNVSISRQVLITAEDENGNVLSSKPIIIVPQGASTEKVNVTPVITVTVNEIS